MTKGLQDKIPREIGDLYQAQKTYRTRPIGQKTYNDKSYTRKKTYRIKYTQIKDLQIKDLHDKRPDKKPTGIRNL